MAIEAKTIHRLSPDQLDAVRRAVAGTISINSNTTPLQAGFQLGVQHVLNALRDGFVTAVPTPDRS